MFALLSCCFTESVAVSVRQAEDLPNLIDDFTADRLTDIFCLIDPQTPERSQSAA